jgi:hypothetical protein
VASIAAARLADQPRHDPPAPLPPKVAAEKVAAESQGIGPRMNAGKVVETMDSGAYTYVRVDLGDDEIWAAAPQFAVEVGDSVSVPPGAPMPNYHSKTLDRSFDMIYFVQFVLVEGAEQAPGTVQTDHSRTQPRLPQIDLSGIEKADGGKTVGEIFDERESLAGQAVTVRGKVVKFTGNILGKNWIHLQDGTAGAGGSDDLVLTTTDDADIGDTVLVTGTVTLNTDLGFGYRYDVLLENSRVTVE